jgi:predicted nucleotide-binding protein
MRRDQEGEWRQDGDWYVLEARTRKSFGRFKVDASSGLFQGLQGLVTTHRWDRFTCFVDAPGAHSEVRYEPDERGWKLVTVKVRFDPLGSLFNWMTFSWVRNKILSDIKHTTLYICGTSTSEDKNVFIVHGHSLAHRQELANLLEDWGLHPIVLDQEDDLGLTVIEKFEYYAKNCCFAFILMTPDDLTAPATAGDRSAPAQSQWRARQNVILELGYFMANLGRERVVILCRKELEIPSDIHGIVAIRFEESLQEVRDAIRRRLRGALLVE